MDKLVKYAGLIFLIASFYANAAFAATTKGDTLVKEAWDKVEIRATVEAIDYKTREVVLMGPHGNLTSVIAGKEVKRLNDIHVDDIIVVEYLTYLSAEFRKPTAAEEKEPLVVVADAGRAPSSMDPRGEIGAIVKAVVSIEIINRPEMEVTIKGPRGNYFSVDMTDKELITELNVGQRLIMTYAEAVAISLEKVK
ncbi:MAG: hypothetical protein ACC707_14775 [Thiohalomonadales bacterium]